MRRSLNLTYDPVEKEGVGRAQETFLLEVAWAQVVIDDLLPSLRWNTIGNGRQ